MDFCSEVAEWDARLGPAWVHTRGHAERGWLARARGLAAAQVFSLRGCSPGTRRLLAQHPSGSAAVSAAAAHEPILGQIPGQLPGQVPGQPDRSLP